MQQAIDKGGIIFTVDSNGSQFPAVVEDSKGNPAFVPTGFTASNGSSQNGFVDNREIQIVGDQSGAKESTGYNYFDTGRVDDNGSRILSTNNPAFATKNGFRQEVGEILRPSYRF